MAAAALHHLIPPPLRSDDQDEKKDNDQTDGDSQDDMSSQRSQTQDSQHRHHHHHHQPRDEQRQAPLSDEQRYSQQHHGSGPQPGHHHHHHHFNPLRPTEEQQDREDEKQRIAHLAADFKDKGPLEIEEIMMDPNQKIVGHSSPSLRCKDFELMKTLGTGTFARVWLTRLAKAHGHDKDKVFALKILRKVDVIRLKQVEHVRNERNILAAVAGHPFITTMITSFQDRDSLYMLLDYCPGGEVFSYLRRARRFNETTSQFYAAEICLILEFLHDKEGVAYRDLKPENILIDAEGHLKLVDFGFAKRIYNRETYTLCGTPEYLAPEVIRNTGHGCAVDWWAFGILIYEFLVGQPPFWDQNPMKIYEQIVEGKIRYPSAMSENARDIISKLCTVDTSKRLGNISGGARSVKSHPWFKIIDWDDLYHRRIKGPIIPHLKGPSDARNFDDYDPEPEDREQYTDDLRGKWDDAFKDF